MAHPGGRPTLYKPEYCQQLIEHMAQGKSITHFAASIGVCKQTIYSWTQLHIEFMDAKRLAVVKCQAKWEDYGELAMMDKNMNAAVWIYNMKCRFKDDWHDPEPVKETNDSKAAIEAEIAKQLTQAKDEPK